MHFSHNYERIIERRGSVGGNVTDMTEMLNKYFSSGNPEREASHGRPSCRREADIKDDLKAIRHSSK